MFLRLLFILLSALNIAVGAWLLLGQPYQHVRRPVDPGVPQLELLSEMPQAAATVEPAAAPTEPPPAPAADVAPGADALASNSPVGDVPVADAPKPPEPAAITHRCLAIGPFATPQDLRNARQAVGPQATRMRSRQEQTSQSSGYWVYLPASGSRALALEQARQLGARHIQDYFVVSAGDQPNTVSLGLFKDPANARKRRDEVVAAGFPARMSERIETTPEYWLDLVVPDTPRFEWRNRVRTAGVGSHSTGCF
jgi:hypothetical protein